MRLAAEPQVDLPLKLQRLLVARPGASFLLRLRFEVRKDLVHNRGLHGEDHRVGLLVEADHVGAGDAERGEDGRVGRDDHRPHADVGRVRDHVRGPAPP